MVCLGNRDHSVVLETASKSCILDSFVDYKKARELQKNIVRTGHGTTDWFHIGKGVHQGCILSPFIITYVQSTSCEMLGWMKQKLESRLPGEISVTSDV